MQNLISNVLGINGFVILNKAVVKALGMHEAVVLGFLIDKWAYFQHADFYYTIQDLSNDTDLSERECRNIMRKLVDKGILIKRAFEGIPPKQYYNINQNAIIDILKNPMPTKENPTKDLTLADSNPFKSDTLNPCKNDRVNTCKNDRDNIYINNKASNNKDINNTEKEKTKKEKELADSLFVSFGFEKENPDSAFKAKEKQDDLESLENEFNQIWDIYPKKQDKQSALNSYIKARKGSKIASNSKGNTKVAPQSFEAILKGVKNYLRANRGIEVKFIKHLSTFLNQATYLDFQGEVNLNRRVGIIDDHEDYLNADKSIYIPK